MLSIIGKKNIISGLSKWKIIVSIELFDRQKEKTHTHYCPHVYELKWWALLIFLFYNLIVLGGIVWKYM